MIYLITGVPGSGKTLYAVSTLVQKLMAEKIKGKDGVEKTRRVVVDGIPNLLIPHEQMDTLVEDDKGNFSCEGDGLLTWPKWCQPGDVLVVDEVQRYWRPRGMGTKPPEMIKALETHRHLGVDFVIITQNPMLIDQNVRRLIGRHQHVRRLLGMARACIYDWDGCSVDVNRTKSATMTMWSYPKSAYKLYKSSELHTKQRQKIPLWLIVPVLALIGGLAVAPQAFSTMRGAMSGKGISSAAVVPSAPASAPVSSVALGLQAVPHSSAASAPIAIASAPVLASAVHLSGAKVSGCIATPKKCDCFDSGGVVVAVEAGFCQSHILGFSVPGQKADISGIPTFAERQVTTQADADVLSFMQRNRKASF